MKYFIDDCYVHCSMMSINSEGSLMIFFFGLDNLSICNKVGIEVFYCHCALKSSSDCLMNLGVPRLSIYKSTIVISSEYNFFVFSNLT
jgi:hypothetical protein